MPGRARNESVTAFLERIAGQSRPRRKEPKPDTDRKFYLYDRYIAVSDLGELSSWFIAQVVHLRDHGCLSQDAEERRRQRYVASLNKGEGAPGEGGLIVELAAQTLSRFAGTQGIIATDMAILVDEVTHRQDLEPNPRRFQIRLKAAKKVLDQVRDKAEFLAADDWPDEPESPEAVPQAGTEHPPDMVRHSDDFTSVVWFGQTYQFAKGHQAGAVRCLWEEWERGTPTLGQETIAERLDACASFRVPRRNLWVVSDRFGGEIPGS